MLMVQLDEFENNKERLEGCLWVNLIGSEFRKIGNSHRLSYQYAEDLE